MVTQTTVDVVIQNDRRLQEEEANALTLGTTPVRSGSTDGKGSGEVTEDVEAPAAEPVDFPDAFRSSVYFDRLERDIREVEDKSRSIVLGTEYVSEYASNVFRQIWFVSIRTWQNLIRNPLATYAALFQVLFMALLVRSRFSLLLRGTDTKQHSSVMVIKPAHSLTCRCRWALSISMSETARRVSRIGKGRCFS